MPRASDPANQSELYRHLRRAGGSIALTVEREGEELRVVHRRLVGKGGTWWTYIERLLPAEPVQDVVRAEWAGSAIAWIDVAVRVPLEVGEKARRW